MNFIVPARSGRQRDPEREPKLSNADRVPGNSDATLLRELAERMFMPRFQRPGLPPTRPRVMPGTIPTLPFHLPLPAGARVIGSVLTRLPIGEPQSDLADFVELYIDVLDPGFDAEVFYESALGAEGWSRPHRAEWGPSGGFALPERPDRRGALCAGPNGPWLQVLHQTSGDATQLWLHIDLATSGPCAEPQRRGHPREDNPIPRLTEPQGIEVRLRGGGGGSGDWHADATSDTDLSVAALERHYAAQLEAAGWTQRSMSADEDIAWSLWDIPPARLPNGRGMLTVVKTPDGRSRWLHVSAHGDRDD